MADAGLHIGGGATVVGTEEALLVEEGLRRQAERCRTAAGLLRSLDDGRGDHLVAAALRDAAAEAAGGADRLGALADGVRLALDLYAGAESATRSGIEAIASGAASGLGLLASRVGLVLAPTALGAAMVGASVVRLLPSELRSSIFGAGADALHASARVLGDPGAVEVVRWLVTLTDDAALGMAGVPATLTPVLGESGMGLTGVPASATTILGLAALARIHGTAPTAVRAEVPLRGARGEAARAATGTPGHQTAPAPALSASGRSVTVPVAAPSGVAERVARIPDSSGPQVRVERYAHAHGDRFEVYIGGTDPTAVPGGSNPWDMASNIALIAEQEASSQQAAAQALAEAGAGPTSSVVFTGYSQGAAIAVRLAESGMVDTAGLVTIGGPTGSMPVTGDYPAVVIEHRDDVVTALAGEKRETAATVVTATALPHGSDDPLAAHAHERYAATASLVDESDLESLAELIGRLPRGGAAGSATVYRAERLTTAD